MDLLDSQIGGQIGGQIDDQIRLDWIVYCGCLVDHKHTLSYLHHPNVMKRVGERH